MFARMAIYHQKLHCVHVLSCVRYSLSLRHHATRFVFGSCVAFSNYLFLLVPERISFPGEEEKVLSYWDQIKAFETSLKLSEGKPEYSFYDGPPFATGLPHYGHLLAGTIKVLASLLYPLLPKGILFCAYVSRYSSFSNPSLILL